MPRSDIVSRRKQIIGAIRSLTREHRHPPTVREVASIIGQPVSTTHKDLAALRDEGKVEWHEHKPRTLRVVRKGR